MRLLVDKITDISRAYSERLKFEELNYRLNLVDPGSVSPFSSDVLIEYHVSRIDRRVLLGGQLTAELSLQCDRCLVDVPEQLDESFSVVLNIVDDEASTKEDLELDDDQINSIIPVDGEIDMFPVLEEQLLLSLPLQCLCQENCSGLCPYCGADLNKADCACEPRYFNNRFGKLKNLKIDPS